MNMGYSKLLAILWLVVILIGSILAPLIAPQNPLQPVGPPLMSPSDAPPLGTDHLGRDLWSRIWYGGRNTLGASAIALLITIVLGSAIGLISARYGGPIDRWLSAAANTGIAIPGILLALLLVAALGPGFTTIVLAVGLGAIPGFSRLSRMTFIQIYREGYVAAAAALGAGSFRIASRHVLPNAFRRLLPLITTYFAWAMLGLTTLTFLGLAGDPSQPEWGVLLNTGRAYLFEAPWLALIPGLAISLTVIAVHAFGTGIPFREGAD
jgi:ABC-type dipeptide/oligopeptide/nickel transport system permease subunit